MDGAEASPVAESRAAVVGRERVEADRSGLLVTIDYPQHQKHGPPFAVHDDEVRAQFANDWSIDRLERRDILAQEQDGLGAGLASLHTSAYRLCAGHPAPNGREAAFSVPASRHVRPTADSAGGRRR